MISEKIKLLGAGLYENIPPELTLKAIPTSAELEYVGAEDFETTMLDKIFPQAIEEKVNFRELLEVDFYWICRCLRILNYGPYHSTNAIFCPNCGMSYGDYQVNLNTVGCKDLPEGFSNDIIIPKDEFLDFDQDIHLKLLTIQEMLNAYKDKAFLNGEGRINKDLARACYMITSIGNKKTWTPFEKKMHILNKMTSADYIVLKENIANLTDYGLRAGGSVQCPKCKSLDASFYALVDDRYFRVSLANLREWKRSRNRRKDENVSGDTSENV